MSRPSASHRANLVTALLGVWFTAGLMLDAWAHNNVPQLESFFTPWHAVFYSGFAATGGWIAWTARGALRSGVAAIPIGYASAVVAVAGFAVAAVGDFIWHTVFGIEQNIDILFSPTHLGLIAAMLVIVTAPLRAGWADRSLPAAPGLHRLLPVVVSVSLATTQVLLFLQYANALTFGRLDIVAALSTLDEDLTAGLVSAMAVTGLVLVVPLLSLARRWILPFGAATILYGAVAALSGAITGFDNLEIIIGLVCAGVCVDLLAWWLRPAPDRLSRYRLFGALTPLVTWSLYIGTAYITAPPLRSPPDVAGAPPEPMVEVYTGAPLVQALLGLVVAVLLVPARTDQDPKSQPHDQPSVGQPAG